MRTLLSMTILIALLLACSRNITDNIQNTEAQISIELNLPDANSGYRGFAKPATITTVRVRVTAGDITEPIVKNLTLSADKKKAIGIVSVKKGNNRKFEIEGIDQNNVVQFAGSATKNIVSDQESVTITVAWIPPPVISFSVSQITNTSAVVTWSPVNIPDFARYLILLGPTAQLNPNNPDHVLLDIPNQQANSAQITNLDPGTDYYVAVLAIDTENLFNSATQAKKFTTASASEIELIYDDGSFEDGLFGPQNSALTVEFEPPSYPAFVKTIKVNLANNDIGNQLSAFILESSVLFEVVIPAMNDWVQITPDWSTVSSNGVVNQSFDVGISFLVDNGPFVLADTNSTYSGRSWYRDPTGNWFQLHETGYSYNLMIRTVVVLQTGEEVELSPRIRKKSAAELFKHPQPMK